MMPNRRAMREQSLRVGKIRFRPRKPARGSQAYSRVYAANTANTEEIASVTRLLHDANTCTDDDRETYTARLAPLAWPS